MPFKSLLLLTCTLSSCFAWSQSWQWAKNRLVIEGIQTYPSKTVLDSRNNTILLSLKLDRQIISKHDGQGNLLWKRELFLTNQNSQSLTDITLDGSDNIYLAMQGVSRIDSIVTNTAPYSIIKLNQHGRFLWSKQIDYNPGIFGPQIVNAGDRVYVIVSIRRFESLTYQSVVYNNIGGNTTCAWLAALDTAGNVQWTRRMYSPAKPITCNSRDATPRISVNQDKDIFLVGETTDKLMVESTPVIDFPEICRHFVYGMVIDGNNGQVKWARDLQLDSIAANPNYRIIEWDRFSTVLSNGYSVVYRYITKDSLVNSNNYQIIELSNKIYLFNKTGNLIRKHAIGSLDSGWHRMYQLTMGDGGKFFSAGQFFSRDPKKFEVVKWDTLFATNWKKNVEYNYPISFFSSGHLRYRNNLLNVLVGCGFETTSSEYAYFGADSLIPYDRNLLSRIVDSSNFLGGTVFFDLNQNNIRDNGEPGAPGILIGASAGDTIYASTKATGYYEMSVSPRAYNLKPLNVAAAYPDFTIVSPANNSATVSGYGNYIRNLNFGLKPSAIITDGQINVTLYGIARPGGIIGYQALIRNTGALNFTGTYKISFDTSRIVYLSSQVSPINTSLPVLTYSFANLGPLTSTSNYIEFRVKTSAHLDDTIKLKAELLTTPTDALAINNIDSNLAIVRTSFDPNIKEVYPFKNVRYDSVVAGKQELDYRIHFQNTGKDTAFAILIRDTLDSKLDITSFHIISSSHPVTVTREGANVIGFYFPNIQLPDSNKNEPRSHGFVRYRIKPRTNVQLSDVVKNNANIYFDYNSPVVTNTVVTNFLNIVTGINEPSLINRGIQFLRNPASGNLYFKVIIGNLSEKMILNMYDQMGRLVLTTSKMINIDKLESVDISRLSAGIYYFELKGKKNKYVEKVVVQ